MILLILAQVLSSGSDGWFSRLWEKLSSMANDLTSLVSASDENARVQAEFLAKALAHNDKLQQRLETAMNRIADLQAQLAGDSDQQKVIDRLTAQAVLNTSDLRKFARNQWGEDI